jgi:hypothetical protein
MPRSGSLTNPSLSGMSMHSADAEKVELIARLVAVMRRTFSAAEGREAGVRTLSDRLLRLDDATLRQLAASFGLDEPGEPEPEER